MVHTAPAARAERSDLSDLTSRLRLTATRLARQLRQQSDSGLSPSQLSALAAIDRAGPLTLGSLAEIERVAPPTITKVVDKMQEAGLVERRADEEDRRVTRVAVTVEGLRMLAHIRARNDAWLATRLAKLSPQDLGRLAGAIDVLEALVAGERT